MTSKETRKQNLAFLLQAKAKGKQRTLADALELAPSFVSQLLTGHRQIGDRLAQKIEKAYRLRHGALDVPLEGSGIQVSHGAAQSALGPFYDELALYWGKLPVAFQQAVVEMVRLAATIDRGRRGLDGDGDHPRRRASDREPAALN